MIRSVGLGDISYLLWGLGWTAILSGITFVLGGLLGAALAVARAFGNPVLKALSIGYIRVFQGTPLLVQLFVIFFAPSYFGIQAPALLAASLGLSLNSAAFLGEIWRGSLEAVPRGQWDAGRSLGLHRARILRLIILPQAVRQAVPPTVGFLVQLVKATALASIIGFTELTRAGQVVINSTFQPFTVFSLVAVGYFLVCWPISIWGNVLERKARRP